MSPEVSKEIEAANIAETKARTRLLQAQTAHLRALILIAEAEAARIEQETKQRGGV